MTPKLVGYAGLVLVGAWACVGTPTVRGVPGTSPCPKLAWTPPPPSRKAADSTHQLAAVPPDLQQRISRLTLPEVIDLGLANNPATRDSWANARAAAAAAYTSNMSQNQSQGKGKK